MRTGLILLVGFLALAAAIIFSRLFAEHFPSATSWGVYSFITLWLLATGFNMWVGVSKAGYSIGEELPIMLLLFAVPALTAGLVKWKIL
jgi:hypothetical protein